MTDSRSRILLASGYLLAAMLVIVPLFEGVFQAWPPTPSAIRWRYGLIGYAGNNLALPVVGSVLALMTAAWLEHRRTLKLLTVVGFLTALMLIAGLGLFSLDAIELRQLVDPQLQRAFDGSALKAFASLAFGALTLAWVSWGGSRSVRGTTSSGPESSTDWSPGIVSTAGRRSSRPGHDAEAETAEAEGGEAD